MTVADNPSVVRIERGELVLWRAGDATPRSAVGNWPDNTVFAAPSRAVRLATLAVGRDERKHLNKSLPFMLEEDVIDEIEQLHFAHQLLDDERAVVAICSLDSVNDWRALLLEDWEGHWVPECQCLPSTPGSVCAVVEDDEVLVSWGGMLGTRVPAPLLATLLNALDEPINAVVLYGRDQSADTALIPEPLRDCVQWRQGGFGQALLLWSADDARLNLRQGTLAPKLPLARWWSQWRKVAVAAGVALTLQFGADLGEYYRFKGENLALRGAIQAAYRQANPRGAVVDVEKQLDRQLAEFNPAAAGVAFTPLLATITQALAVEGALSVSSLNFNGASGEVRLDLSAQNYAAVESLRQRLEGEGLSAVLETSSSRNDQVRARLRVGGKPS